MTSTGVSNTLLMTAMAGNVKQGNVKDTGGKNFDQLMQTSQNKTSFMGTTVSKPDTKKVEQNPQMETKRSDTVQKKLNKKELAQTTDVKEKTDTLEIIVPQRFPHLLAKYQTNLLFGKQFSEMHH